MRRILTGFVVAAVMAVVPTLALAGNQEIAEQIARKLRNSGQMSDYKIGVKYQDGTAWLRGRVARRGADEHGAEAGVPDAGVTRVVNELTRCLGRAGQAAQTRAGEDPAAIRCAARSAPRPRSRSRRTQPGRSGWKRSAQRRTAEPIASRTAPIACPSSYRRLAGRDRYRPKSRRKTAAADGGAAACQADGDRQLRGDAAAEHARTGGAQRRPDADVHGGRQPAGVAPARYDQPACRTMLGQAMRLTRTTPP